MLLKGKEAAEKILQECRSETEKFKEKEILPTLAIFRVGEKDSDLSYERGISKRCEETGIRVLKYVFKKDDDPACFYEELKKANQNSDIHGILVFRPLPSVYEDEKVRNSILPEKDVDGCSDLSLAGLLTGKKDCFAPCTAQAAMAILDHYQIELAGKNAVVLGRSLVIGKPVALLLVNRNVTVTICHSRSRNIEKTASKADILICATGQLESVDSSYVNQNQTIIDVGIGFNEKKNRLCGDVLFEEVEPIVKNITPVPGGVGSVTSSILVRHVIEACRLQNQ